LYFLVRGKEATPDPLPSPLSNSTISSTTPFIKLKRQFEGAAFGAKYFSLFTQETGKSAYAYLLLHAVIAIKECRKDYFAIHEDVSENTTMKDLRNRKSTCVLVVKDGAQVPAAIRSKFEEEVDIIWTLLLISIVVCMQMILNVVLS
jgi:hypothetical protein